MTNKNVTLNVWNDNAEFISVIQGEVDSRFLIITLEDNNGAIDLSNKTVKFLAQKPDDTVVYNNMTIEDAQKGIAILELTSQMSAKAGLLKDCEVQIINSDGDTLIAKGLNLYVKPALGEATEESMSEVTVYQEVLETTESFKTHLSNTSNPHNVTIAQIGAMPNTANYGFSLEISGRNLSLKDQHENTLTTIEMPPTTNSEVTTTSAGLMSSSDKIKLNGIEDGAEVNVQSDWNQSNTSSDDYIKNKPSIPAYLADLSGTLTVVKGGTGASTASAALINLGAQASTDNSLTTTSKTVTGAINELHSAIGTLNDSLEGTLNGN